MPRVYVKKGTRSGDVNEDAMKSAIEEVFIKHCLLENLRKNMASNQQRLKVAWQSFISRRLLKKKIIRYVFSVPSTLQTKCLQPKKRLILIRT